MVILLQANKESKYTNNKVNVILSLGVKSDGATEAKPIPRSPPARTTRRRLDTLIKDAAAKTSQYPICPLGLTQG